MSGQGNQNKHDLNNAGNVLGSMYNTGQYDPNQKEKKGMKFFWIMVVVVTLASGIFLLIKPYPTIDIVRADDDGIVYYMVDVNIFGKHSIDSQKTFGYSDNSNESYYGITGRNAQLARTAASVDADFIVADREDLEIISSKLSFEPAVLYVNTIKADSKSILSNTKNGSYGLPVSIDYKVIEFGDNEYIALLPGHSPFSDGQFRNVLKNMTAIYD
jgi:hypothetical protein